MGVRPPAEKLILVDPHGRAVGTEDKAACHRGEGLRHAAFLVMAFAPDGSLVLARRSGSKLLWPGYWDGTVASHYYSGLDREATVGERLDREIGIRTGRPALLFSFEYQARFEDKGSENEYCDIFRLEGVEPAAIAPDPVEVSEIRLVRLNTLREEAARDPRPFTPWLLIALKRLAGAESAGRGRAE
jgi:isopentenyl-diphosphate delta-isomerase